MAVFLPSDFKSCQILPILKAPIIRREQSHKTGGNQVNPLLPSQRSTHIIKVCPASVSAPKGKRSGGQLIPTFTGAQGMPSPEVGLGGGAAKESQAGPQLELAKGNDRWELPPEVKFRGKFKSRNAQRRSNGVWGWNRVGAGGTRSFQMARCFKSGTEGLKTNCWAPPT